MVSFDFPAGGFNTATMLELEEARARILAAIKPLPTEFVALEAAAGRVVAEPVRAPLDLPLFDNSAMDGYAVHAADLQAARPSAPVALKLAGQVAAGDVWARPIGPGTCMRIFTGSALPPGADAVVMQEDVRLASEPPEDILFCEPTRPGENVRFHGEDVHKGDALVVAGDPLTAGVVGLLAAQGLAKVNVRQRPVTGLLATGSELVEPGQPLPPGKIYESNLVSLAVLARGAGAEPRVGPLTPDNLPATREALEAAFAQSDAVVTTGGASVGEPDLVKRAFTSLGGTVEFWKVAMRPGRPFVFGSWQDKFLFGLPGNPVSAVVTFLLLVRPALLRMQGARRLDLPSHPGVLAEPLANRGDRRHFVRVIVDERGQVRSAGLQASHILSSLARANGLVDLPPQSTLAANSPVQVIRW